MKICLFAILLVSVSALAKPMTHQEFKSLTSAQQAEVVTAYREFFAAIPAEEEATVWRMLPATLSWISEAVADETYDCVNSGWPSRRVNGLCSSPAKQNSSYKAHAAACSGATLVCQPMLFGMPELCAKTGTQAQRNTAFAQCEALASKDGRTPQSIAKGISIPPSSTEADELFQTVDRICTKGFQATMGVCTNLKRRVATIRDARPAVKADETAVAVVAPEVTPPAAVVPEKAAATEALGPIAQDEADAADELEEVVRALGSKLPVVGDDIAPVNCVVPYAAGIVITAPTRGVATVPTVDYNNRIVVEENKKVRPIQCPRAPKDAPIRDYSEQIDRYNITFYPDRKSIEFTRDFQSFMFELSKFPARLLKEMAERKGSIRVIVGKNGVNSDPTILDVCYKSYQKSLKYDQHFIDTGKPRPPGVPTADVLLEDCKRGTARTFDNRSRSTTSGSGGIFSNPDLINPTRIVINELYEKPSPDGKSIDFQGTTNLVLHEHAHALDDMYRVNGISSSPGWTRAISGPATKTFMNNILTSYEIDNANEGFAELFTYYHSCAEARQQMLENAPELHEFLKNLTSSRPYRP